MSAGALENGGYSLSPVHPRMEMGRDRKVAIMTGISLNTDDRPLRERRSLTERKVQACNQGHEKDPGYGQAYASKAADDSGWEAFDFLPLFRLVPKFLPDGREDHEIVKIRKRCNRQNRKRNEETDFNIPDKKHARKRDKKEGEEPKVEDQVRPPLERLSPQIGRAHV